MSDSPTPEEKETVRAAVRRHLGTEALEVRKLVGRAGRRVFFVTLEDREVVLKVLNVRKSRSVGCDFAVEGLLQVGVPTPRVLAVDRTGRYEGEFFEYPFLILEKAPGVPMDRWLLQDKPEPRECLEVLRRIGEDLRKVHSVRAASGWGYMNDRGIGRFGSWHEYLEGHTVRRGDGEMARALDTGWLVGEGWISSATRARVDAIFKSRHGFRPPAEARLVHNDLTLKNIFIDPAELRVTAVLDLHNALAGDPALDLARFEYFYRGRGHYEDLRKGYGEGGAEFERRCFYLLVFVLLEKLTWLRGREERFPGRLESDVALLEDTVEMLA